MSRLSPLSLPRFHGKALARTVRAQETHVESAPALDAFSPESDAEPELPIEEIPTDTLQVPVIPEPELVDTAALLGTLEASLEDVRRAALEKSSQTLADFLHGAFPRLCEHFLAEEVTRAVGQMAPPEIEGLRLQVPAAFEASFRQALLQSEHLSEICDLQPMDARDEMIVDVDWRDGGLHFDMDQFLNSCLGRLSGTANT